MRGVREGDGEAVHTSGAEGERHRKNKCSGTALAIAHSVATLTFPSTPFSVVNVEQSI